MCWSLVLVVLALSFHSRQFHITEFILKIKPRVLTCNERHDQNEKRPMILLATPEKRTLVVHRVRSYNSIMCDFNWQLQRDVEYIYEEWRKMFELVALMQNLRLLNLDVEYAYCTLGCCRLWAELPMAKQKQRKHREEKGLPRNRKRLGSNTRRAKKAEVLSGVRWNRIWRTFSKYRLLFFPLMLISF